MKKLEIVKSIGEKSSVLGTIISLMGCSMCFPAIASLGGAIGMGFLKNVRCRRNRDQALIYYKCLKF